MWTVIMSHALLHSKVFYKVPQIADKWRFCLYMPTCGPPAVYFYLYFYRGQSEKHTCVFTACVYLWNYMYTWILELVRLFGHVYSKYWSQCYYDTVCLDIRKTWLKNFIRVYYSQPFTSTFNVDTSTIQAQTNFYIKLTSTTANPLTITSNAITV